MCLFYVTWKLVLECWLHATSMLKFVHQFISVCFPYFRTAHERAHLLSEQRQNALKWPWERVVNVATSLDASDFEAQKYSDPQLYEKFK